MKKMIFYFIFMFFTKSNIDHYCVELKYFLQTNPEIEFDSFFKDFLQSDLLDNDQTVLFKKNWKNRNVTFKKFLQEEHIEEEIKIMRLLSGNKFFPEYFGCIHKNNVVIFIMETLFIDLEEGRDDFVKMKNPRERVEFYLKLAKGMRALHQEGYVHGSLCPSNIMTSDPNFNHVKIIDFEHTVKFGEPSKGGIVLTDSPEKSENPELKAEAKIDVYAFGMTIVFIELGSNSIVENNWDSRVGNILRILSVFTFNRIGTVNPMRKENNNFAVKFYNWFMSFFIDNRVKRIYDMNDLVNNLLAFDPDERINFKSIEEILKSFIEYDNIKPLKENYKKNPSKNLIDLNSKSTKPNNKEITKKIEEMVLEDNKNDQKAKDQNIKIENNQNKNDENIDKTVKLTNDVHMNNKFQSKLNISI